LVDMTEQSAGSARTAGLDLHLGDIGRNVRAGLMNAFREAIRSGRLAPGTRLPSSRVLATDLGLGRNTVVRVYSELINEGWRGRSWCTISGPGSRICRRSHETSGSGR
jgi:GntR family transcriptional regulator/MocR family aminotransferase